MGWRRAGEHSASCAPKHLTANFVKLKSSVFENKLSFGTRDLNALCRRNVPLLDIVNSFMLSFARTEPCRSVEARTMSSLRHFYTCFVKNQLQLKQISNKNYNFSLIKLSKSEKLPHLSRY